jgi:hypothetical protein
MIMGSFFVIFVSDFADFFRGFLLEPCIVETSHANKKMHVMMESVKPWHGQYGGNH